MSHNISASKVKKHSQCPLAYWFRYKSDKEPTKAESDYLALGSRVHEAIEDALTAESPPPLDHEEAIKAAIQNLYAEMDEYPLPDDMYSDGMKYCAKAAEYIAKRVPDIRDVEKRVEFQISRDDMSTGVTAIMDITTDTEIWDWKTGKIRDDTPHEEKIQGSIYMAAYLNEYGHEPERIIFVYVKEGKVRKIEPGDEIWEYMIKRAKRLVMDKDSGNFEGKPGDHCYWCRYSMWCSESPCGVGDVPFEEY